MSDKALKAMRDVLHPSDPEIVDDFPPGTVIRWKYQYQSPQGFHWEAAIKVETRWVATSIWSALPTSITFEDLLKQLQSEKISHIEVNTGRWMEV